MITPRGTILYSLYRKKVKNYNLRVSANQEILLSVPRGCKAECADQFVFEKCDWLYRCIQRQENESKQLLPILQEKEIKKVLEEAVCRVYPLVKPSGVAFPKIKLRRMKSQWGNCHWENGYITLNTALARCPAALREYVALHELIHFIHPDHGIGFYADMDRLMPGWRVFRRELRSYSAALCAPINGPVDGKV